MRLKHKTAIITGGGTGIGKAIAYEFAAQGANVVICGLSQEYLDQAAKEIEKKKGKTLALVADVVKYSQTQHVVEKAIKDFGQIDILVNNAGIYIPNDVLSATEEEWEKTLCIDVKGVWHMSRAVMPHFVVQNKGKIINIASISGIVGFEKTASYASAKAAVLGLTREMAVDFASTHVNVNAIAPGVIDTDMTKKAISDKSVKENILKKTPLGRIGRPEDIAFAAVYLASEESDFVTGQTLVVDGGWTIV